MTEIEVEEVEDKRIRGGSRWDYTVKPLPICPRPLKRARTRIVSPEDLNIPLDPSKVVRGNTYWKCMRENRLGDLEMNPKYFIFSKKKKSKERQEKRTWTTDHTVESTDDSFKIDTDGE